MKHSLGSSEALVRRRFGLCAYHFSPAQLLKLVQSLLRDLWTGLCWRFCVFVAKASMEYSPVASRHPLEVAQIIIINSTLLDPQVPTVRR